MTRTEPRCGWFACALALAVLGSAPVRARALASEVVLYNFTGGVDGGNPQAGVIRDLAGNLYGTTRGSGTANSGVVYKLDATGHETILYSFTGGADGANPEAGVIRDSAGNLYGTTYRGGTGNRGLVYKLDATGHETVLHRFTGGADGGGPKAGVIRDSAGNLYGTTAGGGNPACSVGCGVVYKVDAAGHITVLHSFTGGADGANPVAGLIRDSAGNLYGAAYSGGTANKGVVYKLDVTGHETVLYSFTGGADGSNPEAGVIRDSAGSLYGTTYLGGSAFRGVVYKLDATGHETVLYRFTGGFDGANPVAGLIRDLLGNLYGTTSYGGGGNQGVVYKLDTTGHESVLYSFSGGTDGASPYAGVIRDSGGNLYGTTNGGGTSGSGVVFQISAAAATSCLRWTIDGERMPPMQFTKAGMESTFVFALPPGSAAKSNLNLTVEVSRTVRVGADQRDMGLAFGRFEIK